MSNSLEERLRANSNAFDGLLELIPAKYYYDEQTQDQWKAKKKSKSQAKDDKSKKLDPNSQSEEVSTALDVMKRREVNAKPVVLPGQRLKEMREAQRQAAAAEASKQQKNKKDNEDDDEDDDDLDEREIIKMVFDDEGNAMKDSNDEESVSEVETEGEKHAAIKEAKKEEHEKQTEEAKLKKQRNLDALRAKLQSKIQNMKNKRKAPGAKVDGAPASREAILKQRQYREELRKKRVLPENDDSDSDNSDIEDDEDVIADGPQRKKSKNDDINADGVIFQNIMFDDGDRATSDLQRIRKNGQGKKKGPAKNDLKAHLKILEERKSKLASRDELDQIKQKEKDKWQRTMLQTEGIKIKDDEKLLKKAIKRKEAKKRKSEIEWKERKQLVADTKAERVKRREENLQIRKENKGVKRSKQQKMKRKFKGVITPKKRAGFEGRLKSGKGRR